MPRPAAISDLPETIALFPLPGALLLPRARLPLNLFEPRYLAMLEDVIKTDHRLIGMIQPQEDVTGSGLEQMQQIGCAGRVISFSETDDGRYMVTLGGVCRFRMVTKVDGFTPYIRAAVEWHAFERDLGPADTDPNFDRARFLQSLSRYFDAVSLSSDWDSLKEADEELLVNSLSMLCPFEREEKQALLESVDLADRRKTLTTLMDFAVASNNTPDEGSLQ